ncbi:MAG: hypothetical protein F4W99_04110 [Chloroflexi bacterium]|nr:hypothetical protein [Chloroflexota bacterium]
MHSRSNSGGGAGRGLALGLLLALAVFILGSAIVQAQTKLVGNLDLSDVNGCGLANDCAQRFTTGGNPAGYMLTRVDAKMYRGSNSHSFSAGIYEGTSNQPNLNSLKGALQTSGFNASTGFFTQQFRASGNGIALAANTSYWLVFDITSGTGQANIRGADSNDEDSDSLSGWSIADAHRDRGHLTTGAWTQPNNRSLLIGLFGHQVTTVAPPIPPNMAYSPVQWNAADPVNTAARHAFPLSLAEIESNRTKDGSGSLDLSGIDASLASEHAERSRGYYLSNRVYSPAEQPALVEQAAGGGYRIVGPDETRYEVVRGSPLVLVKLWHVYLRDSGLNGIERLGGPWFPRRDHLLAEPVEFCLPAPDVDDAAIAVRIREESAWTVLETVEQDGRLCAETVRVGWVIVVEAEE